MVVQSLSYLCIVVFLFLLFVFFIFLHFGCVAGVAYFFCQRGKCLGSIWKPFYSELMVTAKPFPIHLCEK